MFKDERLRPVRRMKGKELVEEMSDRWWWLCNMRIYFMPLNRTLRDGSNGEADSGESREGGLARWEFPRGRRRRR